MARDERKAGRVSKAGDAKTEIRYAFDLASLN